MSQSAVEKFVELIIQSDSPYTNVDRIYVTNLVFRLIGDGFGDPTTQTTAVDLANELVELAIKHGKIENSITNREILEDQLMDLLTPIPSKVNDVFWTKYQQSPDTATNYFYHLSQANDYIKTRAIAKNISYTTKTNYGDLEITINLSKPEKDPKAIAAAGRKKSTSYPVGPLAIENEGYLGRLGYPARSNHRVIRMMIGGQPWGFQYSPYAYFSEHAIFLNQKHVPMSISQQTFVNLTDIIKQFPHYFVGSNADLPIVGGSLLAQDHYQGGRHSFPMMKAAIDRSVDLGIDGLKAGIVKWPMATIRLQSSDANKVITAATKIADTWKDYSDESVDIRAYTDGTRHHTVTPIAYMKDDEFVLDVVLRDNQTSEQYPDGIFHPHKDVQHIKKENIGLIEVMGRAILPARLKTEMKEVEKYVLGEDNQIADYHKPWADELKQRDNFTKDNVEKVVDKEVGLVFARVLEDAGVYKWNSAGQTAFDKFITSVK
ncbi:MAG: UDP-glucose--hexose-1-phosphate uridylyltransferase [Lentilactobacillus diolivorans]|jgi:UDPglucose--hexose-1-phosphate uridylyltransferase|uniref:Galactose-1-phosphate uridylyltransferase n=2 Tax=Lentilactobacillus diolivorans TaxID=179838 RepID=A0A0R1S605_9LACO|nr:UDP-glucose--hexose-1-phosphate uridylyltransferase [Lentilactobacillus diolivorans]KRL64407.1 UTP--hexose-1-phosphate uridylyltransferase [Lentilactobacillus diolivorans DSM 14421]MCH4164243.1 UDP-glucose--hexose-1-phosphate uridylyltransferase [Lentilactobacillus diolivorans]RRG00440.1 MAG: UDP-glucose--hexose-1-phosphate uridylyltransferase [Lactobacillus sp.]GEP23096.1 galactose-1-phosphate uridylyltransferase [Lentilactobacillus diolivorans]